MRKGSLFLSVLLGVSIAIALSVALNYLARVEIKKSYNFRFKSEARLLSRSIIEALRENPLSIPPYELQPGRWVRIESEDLERYININNIILPDGKTVDVKWERIFERLFKMKGVPLDLIPKICDFIDRDRDVRLGGYEGEENLNRRLYLIEELKKLREISDDLLQGFFAKYFTAWSSGKVNLNTASKEVLMALSDDIDESVADAIIEFRSGQSLKGVSDLKKVPGFPEKIIPQISEVACFEGKHFRVRVEVRVESLTLRTEAVISGGRVLYEREGW